MRLFTRFNAALLCAGRPLPSLLSGGRPKSLVTRPNRNSNRIWSGAGPQGAGGRGPGSNGAPGAGPHLGRGPGGVSRHLLLLSAASWEIIKGKEVKAHSRPYMAYLRIQHGTKMGRCGGFLVAENFVLTAAHCQAGKITVVLGAHNISRQEKSQQVIQVKKACPHEEYDDVYSDNDIMLLELSTPAKLSKRVKPIALATAGKIVKPGKKCRVAGWGLTIARNNSSSANTLREVQVKVLKDAECKDWRYNHQTMLCAGKAGKGNGATQGDSGGPLVCRGKAQGIVSWGPIDLPGVYTRLSTFIGWIQETMEGTPFCGPPGLTA